MNLTSHKVTFWEPFRSTLKFLIVHQDQNYATFQLLEGDFFSEPDTVFKNDCVHLQHRAYATRVSDQSLGQLAGT